MSENTKIEWCDSTFNPWVGCTKISPACDNCYAAVSTPARSMGVTWGAGNPRHRTSAKNWKQPLIWNARADAFRECAACGWRGYLALRDEPLAFACPSCDATDWMPARRRVFCASLADVFDNEVPVQWRIDLLDLIRRCGNLDFLLLTKRIGNAAAMLETAFRAVHAGREGWADNVPGNIWIGATITSQAEADRDIPKLLDVPAARRFLSMEPLLGPVGIQSAINRMPWRIGGGDAELHWVIVGGESGPNARPMHPEWARSIRDQCAAAGVPFLFKQWGEWLPDYGWYRDHPVSLPLSTYTNGSWREPGGDASDYMVRCGKKAARRLLDGVEHNGFPVSAVTP